MPKADKRRQIMQAAEKLFTSRRFHEITLDEVADSAGVGKGTIYRYFKDKDDLFLQTAASGYDELLELLRRKVPAGAPFDKRMLSSAVEITNFFQRRRQLFRMIQAEEGRMSWAKGDIEAAMEGRRKKLIGAMAEIISEGVAEGIVRRDVPSDVLASLLLGMLRTRSRKLGHAPKAFQKFEFILDFFLHGAALRHR